MTIRRLPPEVVDLLRAGEVVERPASAVKELVENALDAGARRIEVSIRGGGIDEIRVVDDGAGIAADDLVLAVEPHATSKIADRDDLGRIASYGFRGEALAALAASADVEIISRPAGAGAARLSREGGGWRVAPAAAPPGTTVVARGLFARVPARRKFLRSERAEASAVSLVLERYAIARPDVRFTLVRDGREALRTSGAGDARRAAAEVWGDEVARDLVEVEGVADEVRVSGLAGTPDAGRPTRAHQIVVVNGRPVRDPVVAAALAAAYDGLVGRGLHPPAIVRIDAPPAFVDANVHPTKAEVRFRDPGLVRDLVRRAFRARFRAAPPVARWEFGAVGALTDLRAIVRDAPAGPLGEGGREHHDDPPPPPPGVEILDEDAARRVSGGLQGLPVAGRLVFRGTLGARYVVAAEDDALVLVDAHAAHERVLYERLLAEIGARGRPAVQPLLVPARFEPSAGEAAALEAGRADLAAIGIEVEPFGPRAWVVRAIPAVLAGADPVRLALEAAAAVAEGRAESRSLSDLIARRACRTAVRTGRALEDSEAADLLADLVRTGDPTRCPHGRPTIVRLSLSEIDRRFGRI